MTSEQFNSRPLKEKVEYIQENVKGLEIGFFNILVIPGMEIFFIRAVDTGAYTHVDAKEFNKETEERKLRILEKFDRFNFILDELPEFKDRVLLAIQRTYKRLN